MIFALGRELHALIAAGFRVLEDFSFVIPNNDFLVVVIQDVAGIDRNFAATAGER